MPPSAGSVLQKVRNNSKNGAIWAILRPRTELPVEEEEKETSEKKGANFYHPILAVSPNQKARTTDFAYINRGPLAPTNLFVGGAKL